MAAKLVNMQAEYCKQDYLICTVVRATFHARAKQLLKYVITKGITATAGRTYLLIRNQYNFVKKKVLPSSCTHVTRRRNKIQNKTKRGACRPD